MSANHRPCLRAGIERVSDPRRSPFGYLVDGLRQCPDPVRLALDEFGWLEWFDGVRTLREIQAKAARSLGGDRPPLERLADLSRRLDDVLLLDGPRWREHVARPDREPVCIGCYAAEADVLGQQVEELFTRRGGPGLPGPRRPDGGLRAALIPHIDYARGGVSYAWGFKEVFERTDASLFVIIGT